MLKTRVISALVLAALLISTVVFLPTSGVAIVLGILFLAGAMEWANLTGFGSPARKKQSYVSAVLLAMILLYFAQWLHGILAVAVFAWFLIVVLLAFYQRHEGDVPRWADILGMSGLLFIPAAWLAMLTLHAQDMRLLLFLFALCASADSFAYFAGKKFGKTKLAPELSPGKTREGMLGGLLGVLVVSVLFAIYVSMPAASAVPFVLLCLVCGVISVTGDLFESLMKREAGIKDSGSLIPGHGGVLDRFDSHIAVAPVFLMGLQWI